VNLWVYSNLIKERNVSERPIEITGENVLEIDRLLRIVIKCDAQSVRREKVE
jgi:hypothetical protein